MTSKVWFCLLLCYLVVRAPDAVPPLACCKCDDGATCGPGEECYTARDGAMVTKLGCKNCNASEGCCKKSLCNEDNSAAVPNWLGGGSMMLQVAHAAAI